MRTGYTTGACATAAARGALLSLITQKPLKDVEIVLPAGERVSFLLHKNSVHKYDAIASVIKDAGDDPDVTHGAEIEATVSWIGDEDSANRNVSDGIRNADLVNLNSANENRNSDSAIHNDDDSRSYDKKNHELRNNNNVNRNSDNVNNGINDKSKIIIEGGRGVGRVTQPGLPVAVGEWAINPVPRSMIRNEVNEVKKKYNIQKGTRVIISVPDGEAIAKKTMNARLGIIGGISILGTRGIVVPFSTSAYKTTLVYAIKAASQNGCSHVVLSTGSRTEQAGQKLYPNLAEIAFVEAGEFIGYSLRLCSRFNIKKITLMAMIGKLSKIAAGIMMVHSKKASVDFKFLAEIAKESGAKQELCNHILSANTASQVAGWMQEAGHDDFFRRLVNLAANACKKESQKGQFVDMQVEVILIDMNGNILAKTEVANGK